MKTLLTISFFVLFATSVSAEKSVRVFVALCDNKTQGIAPVGEKIGDGDMPDANLYWGCSDGFGSYFKKSKDWELIESVSDVSETVMRRMRLRHVEGDVELRADAYRGSRIRQCLEDFEAAAVSDKYDLVAYIGHNGLMDFQLPKQKAALGNDTEVVVLCCLSERYFGKRLGDLGCRPVLLTQQLMYPGAFILHDVINVWRAGGSPAEMRAAAGRAYAKNQNISLRSATGVFSAVKISKKSTAQSAKGANRASAASRVATRTDHKQSLLESSK